MIEENNIILVDENDNVTGTAEKMEVHSKGLLHRAFSVVLFDKHGRMLLQKRAAQKYHSPGLWTNACCSHPRLGETNDEAARRRLGEELNVVSDLHFIYSFIYRADLENGLIEHEYDHVYWGYTSQEVKFNTDEVEDIRYMTLSDINKDIEYNPEEYTVWFKILYSELLPAFEKIALKGAEGGPH